MPLESVSDRGWRRGRPSAGAPARPAPQALRTIAASPSRPRCGGPGPGHATEAPSSRMPRGIGGHGAAKAGAAILGRDPSAPRGRTTRGSDPSRRRVGRGPEPAWASASRRRLSLDRGGRRDEPSRPRSRSRDVARRLRMSRRRRAGQAVGGRARPGTAASPSDASEGSASWLSPPSGGRHGAIGHAAAVRRPALFRLRNTAASSLRRRAVVATSPAPRAAS